MFKKIDNWIKKYSYKWYRSEYEQARNISLYCSWAGIFGLLIIMISSQIKPITVDTAQWLAPLSGTLVLLIMSGLIVSGVLNVVDKHEKDLNSRGGK